MKITEEIILLMDERKTVYEKLVQACQSGCYKAWKKRRKNLDEIDAKLKDLNKK